ncbi:MAG TPA: acylphosphatase [Woeseiaceae bacterium]|nr:acylphosphatase [Woeseiaceae bacterium]
MTSDSTSAGGSGAASNDPASTPPGKATKCRRFRITGRVQGVFFRDSTRQLANQLDLKGYANNERDGSVEVVACGPPEALDQLAEWLAHGPPMAKVARVETTEASAADYRKFTIG